VDRMHPVAPRVRRLHAQVLGVCVCVCVSPGGGGGPCGYVCFCVYVRARSHRFLRARVRVRRCACHIVRRQGCKGLSAPSTATATYGGLVIEGRTIAFRMRSSSTTCAWPCTTLHRRAVYACKTRHRRAAYGAVQCPALLQESLHCGRRRCHCSGASAVAVATASEGARSALHRSPMQQ
jgi:hypothetical protein